MYTYAQDSVVSTDPCPGYLDSNNQEQSYLLQRKANLTGLSEASTGKHHESL